MAHVHRHGTGPRRSRAREFRAQSLVLAVTLGILAVQLVGSSRSGSMALLADSLHVATDVLASAISLFVIVRLRAAAQDEDRIRARWNVVSGSLLLVSLAVVAGYAAWRLGTGTNRVHGGEMLRYAVIGCGGNVLQLILLQGAGKNLTTRAQRLHVISDLASSIGVIASALLIAGTGYAWVDPVATIAISAFLAREAWRMVRGHHHH